MEETLYVGVKEVLTNHSRTQKEELERNPNLARLGDTLTKKGGTESLQGERSMNR